MKRRHAQTELPPVPAVPCRVAGEYVWCQECVRFTTDAAEHADHHMGEPVPMTVQKLLDVALAFAQVLLAWVGQ